MLMEEGAWKQQIQAGKCQYGKLSGLKDFPSFPRYRCLERRPEKISNVKEESFRHRHNAEGGHALHPTLFSVVKTSHRCLYTHQNEDKCPCRMVAGRVDPGISLSLCCSYNQLFILYSGNSREASIAHQADKKGAFGKVFSSHLKEQSNKGVVTACREIAIQGCTPTVSFQQCLCQSLYHLTSPKHYREAEPPLLQGRGAGPCPAGLWDNPLYIVQL